MLTLQKLESEAELYEGFIIPRSDALELKTNRFEYDSDEEAFVGMLETEEGSLQNYKYYPTNFLWFSVEDLGEDNY